jgi:hypothetical protein
MFKEEIKQFSLNLDALRDFVDLIEPILKGRLDETSQEQKIILSAFIYAISKIESGKDTQIDLSDDQKKNIENICKIKINKKSESEKSCTINFNSGTFENPEVVTQALIGIRRHLNRNKLLYNSSLISLISAVEWFFSCLLHAFYKKYPQVAISSDKVFSYEDLTRFSNIDEARSQIIEKKVEEVLRGSFSDWIKYFRSNLKMAMTYLDIAIDDLVETCERRNLLVHNNGVINGIYLSRINKTIASSNKIGESVKVDRSYLENRINLFERYCILVCAELWKQIAPNDEERGETLTDIAFEHMKYKRWVIVEGLSFFVMNDKKLPERILLVGKMNYWLSCKRQNRWNEIKEQIEQEDMSARDKLFQLAWYSLCGKEKEFFALLPIALKAKDINLKSLDTFPIFDEFRNKKRFQDIVDKLRKKPKKKNSKADQQIKGKTLIQ